MLAWLKMKKKGVINANDAILNHIYREGVQGALTGIRDVDARMILSNQSFTLVAGVSGTKKTDYLLGIARYNVAQGKRVLFINLKNSAEELAIRLLSIGSQVPVRNILLNQMTEEDWNRITQSLSAGKDNEILFYNSNNDYLQFIKEIKNKIRRQRVSVVLNLCNRLWHKFLGERIACYWISWTARRAVFGMPTKPSKMAGAVQYWNYRFRVV